MFCLQQNQKTKGQNICPEAGRETWGGQIMYTHVSKCKDDKIKIKKKII
jgi:hypothetical protein